MNRIHLNVDEKVYLPQRIEPRCEETENKGTDQLCLKALISAFVFAYQIVQFFLFLYAKFQASSHIL